MDYSWDEITHMPIRQVTDRATNYVVRMAVRTFVAIAIVMVGFVSLVYYVNHYVQ
jgi:hypothetical protein